MQIENRNTGQAEEIPICTIAKFRGNWEPAAETEQLEMLQALGGLWITVQYRDRFLDELVKLKAWASSRAPSDEYIPETNKRGQDSLI